MDVRNFVKLLALGTAVALALAGCGGEESVAEGDPSPGAAAAEDSLPTSHDELVERANAEGQLNALTSFEQTAELAEAFEAAYPEIDTTVGEIAGTDENQRLILELESGQAANYDVLLLHADRYDEVVPFVADVDLAALNEAGVVEIPSEMIDPASGSVAAFASQIGCISYNPQMVPPEQAPQTWEDLLKPEFAGRQMFVDIRPNNMAPLVVEWGLDRVTEYAADLAAQEPIWARGQTAQITQVAAAQVPIHAFCQYDAAYKVQQRALEGTLEDENDEELGSGSLEIVLPEPVPVRLSEALGVAENAQHPNAALLFMHFLATPEGQEVLNLDYKTSIYTEGSLNFELIEGKETSVSGIEGFAEQGNWNSAIVEAFGFPQPEQE